MDWSSVQSRLYISLDELERISGWSRELIEERIRFKALRVCVFFHLSKMATNPAMLQSDGQGRHVGRFFREIRPDGFELECWFRDDWVARLPKSEAANVIRDGVTETDHFEREPLMTAEPDFVPEGTHYRPIEGSGARYRITRDMLMVSRRELKRCAYTGLLKIQGLPRANDESTSITESIQRPPGQQQEQDRVMLQIVKQLGYDPMNLPPKPAQGKPWVRAEVLKNALENTSLFVSRKAAELAWDRFLADHPQEPPSKKGS